MGAYVGTGAGFSTGTTIGSGVMTTTHVAGIVAHDVPVYIYAGATTIVDDVAKNLCV